MALTTDDVARMTERTPDDDAFERSRRNRRRRTDPPPVPDAGPCCGRCRSWVAPERGDDRGACRAVVLARGRRTGQELVMPIEEAFRRGVETFDPLRTAAGFGCGAYVAVAEAER